MSRMTMLSPYTGFGDDYNTSVKFGLRRTNGELPDWDGGDPIATRLRAGGQEITQWRGHTPWTWTVRVWFATRADRERLKAMAGKERQTLRYLYGLTLDVGGYADSILDTEYLTLPNTELTSVVALPNREGLTRGQCEAMVTFRRTYVAPVIPAPQPWPPAPRPIPLPLPSLLLGPGVSHDRSGPVNPTIAGAVRERGTGWFVEEGTTNLVPNPLFDSDAYMWQVYQGDFVTDGGWIHCVSNTGGWHLLQSTPYFWSGDGDFYSIAEVTPGEVYTLSFEAFSVHGRPLRAGFVYRDASGVWQSETTTSFTLTPSTQELTVTSTVPSGAARVGVLFVDETSSIGDTFSVRFPQAEQKSYRTSFCPELDELGALLPGYAWISTPHESASTRAVSEVWTLTEDRIDSVTGSMMFALPQGATPNDSYLFFAGNWGTDDALTLNSNATIGALFRSGGASADYLPSTVASPDARVVYVAWTADTLTLAVNDEAPQTIPRTPPTGSTSATMAVGGVSWAASQINATFGPLVINDRPLTDIERTRLADLMAGPITWADFGP